MQNVNKSIYQKSGDVYELEGEINEDVIVIVDSIFN